MHQKDAKSNFQNYYQIFNNTKYSDILFHNLLDNVKILLIYVDLEFTQYS